MQISLPNKVAPAVLQANPGGQQLAATVSVRERGMGGVPPSTSEALHEREVPHLGN